jgi:hypothetical protein
MRGVDVHEMVLHYAAMTKSLFLAVGLLAAVAAAVWFFTAGPTLPANSSPTSTTTAGSTVTPAPGGSPTSGTKPPTKGIPNSTTYKSLLTQSGSYECDYSTVSASGQTNNVIYMYEGKMRGEFRTNSPGESTSNLFVYDGHYLYQWQEGASTGKRTVLTSLSELPLVIPKDLTSGSIIGNSYTSVGWQCHTWLTNKALLTPPSYVTFK